jgi:hypothetical protein
VTKKERLKSLTPGLVDGDVGGALAEDLHVGFGQFSQGKVLLFFQKQKHHFSAKKYKTSFS